MEDCLKWPKVIQPEQVTLQELYRDQYPFQAIDVLSAVIARSIASATHPTYLVLVALVLRLEDVIRLATWIQDVTDHLIE